MATASSIRVVRGRSQAASLLHRTRHDLLSLLGEPDTAASLARKLGTSRQRLGYHLRQLEREGLIECVAERRNGNCIERVVRATARSFVISPEALGRLGESPESATDRFSAAYLLGSAARVLGDVGMLDARARSQGKRLATLTVQSEIRFATPAARAAFANELTTMLAQLTARYHNEHGTAGRSYRLTAMAHPLLEDTTPAVARAGETSQAQADGGRDDA